MYIYVCVCGLQYLGVKRAQKSDRAFLYSVDTKLVVLRYRQLLIYEIIGLIVKHW